MASVKTRYELKLPVLFSVKRQTGHIFANLSQGDKLMKSRGVQDSLKTVDLLERHTLAYAALAFSRRELLSTLSRKTSVQGWCYLSLNL